MDNITSTIHEKIIQLKQKLGDELCIVGHHYQNDDIIKHCDITGDSLELARKIPDITAKHIIFCGVYFMAESAALLAHKNQNIYIPDAKADCVMAQMAPAALLEQALKQLSKNGRKIIPLAYVNTSLAVKAVVGKYNGAVCTSANAKTMLKWALDAGEQVLFLPDKQLARNTAVQLGLTEQNWHILNITKNCANLDLEQCAKAKMLIWPGCCAIHAKFSTKQITQMREQYPQCSVVVHPECNPDLVQASDGAGSTSYLINYVKNAPQNSTVIVGTETNLVMRLNEKYAKNCMVIPLNKAYCSHMAKINIHNLCKTLEDITQNKAQAVSIPQEFIVPAKSSLECMLEVCAK